MGTSQTSTGASAVPQLQSGFEGAFMEPQGASSGSVQRPWFLSKTRLPVHAWDGESGTEVGGVPAVFSPTQRKYC